MIKTGSGRGGCRRFTLVELMMVVAIIGAIAVLGIGVFNFTNYKIAETRTEGLVNKLDSVFNFMYSKYHMYPLSFTDSSVADRVRGRLIIYYDPNDPVGSLSNSGSALENFSDDYCSEFAKQIDLQNLINNYGENLDGDNGSAGRYEITDSWGRPLFYKAPGNVRTRGFDLCSAGRNGKYFHCRKDNGEEDMPILGDMENMGDPEDDNNPDSNEDYRYENIEDDFGSVEAAQKAFFSSELGDDVTNY